MSDLFTEAIKDAQKLREIAEADAQNAIVKKLTPYIKEMIAKESSADFFFEQDEDVVSDDEEIAQQPAAAVTGQPIPAPETAMVPGEPIAPAAPVGTDVASGELGDTAVAPVSPEGEALANASMPDEDGKITVDFEDLFIDDGQITLGQGELDKLAPVQASGEEAAQLEPPAALEPSGEPALTPAANTGQVEPEPELDLNLPLESVSYPDFQRVFSDVHERVDRVYFGENITDIKRETLKQRLFDLIETVDSMRNGGTITTKQARLQENKLEFLFLKLKEAGLRNSYNMNNLDKDADMKSLKEYAAKLFEEDQNLAKDSQSSGDTGLAVDDEYSEHAASVSGVDPQLGKRADLGVGRKEKSFSEECDVSVAHANPISGDVEEVDGWEDGESAVNEASTAPGEQGRPDADVSEAHAGFGDTNERAEASGLAAESTTYEVDASELAEAVRDIRRESIKKKMMELKEASDGENAESWEDGRDPKRKEVEEDPSLENLEESLMKEMDELEMDDDDEEEMSDEMDVDEDDVDELSDSEANLILSIDLPPEVEEELADLGLGEDDLDVELTLNLDGVDDDEEIIVVDDEEEEDEEEDDHDYGSKEEDMVLVDDESGDEEEDDVMPEMYESKMKHAGRKNRLLERRVKKAVRLLESRDRNIKNLKEQLNETNLFTAKAVYYSKFLQRALRENALNKKALEQIAEHLDKGRTVAETKAIYGAIKRKLDEHIVASRKLDGSSSKVTKPGSASLTESVNAKVGKADPNSQTADRWRVLAGIRNQTD